VTRQHVSAAGKVQLSCRCDGGLFLSDLTTTNPAQGHWYCVSWSSTCAAQQLQAKPMVLRQSLLCGTQHQGLSAGFARDYLTVTFTHKCTACCCLAAIYIHSACMLQACAAQ
jgi:hypothetical protein